MGREVQLWPFGAKWDFERQGKAELTIQKVLNIGFSIIHHSLEEEFRVPRGSKAALKVF
jgi:hypothetical protein